MTSGNGSDDHQPYLKRALTTGVRGFLPKTTSAATLTEAIRSVHAGGRYLDPELAADAIKAREHGWI